MDNFLDSSSDFQTTDAQLTREMTTFHVALLGFGAMVGASIFILAGISIDLAGPGIILAIVLNYLVTLTTGYNYAEQSSRSPEVGGGYLWVKEATNNMMGFISGWVSWLGHSIACSFYILTIGNGIVWMLGVQTSEMAFRIPFLADYVSWGTVAVIIAVVIAFLFLYINFRGVGATGRAELIVVAIQLIVLILFCLVGIVRALADPISSFKHFYNFLPHGIDGVIVAMAVLFIAFEGYEICAQAGEEAKDPHKTIPKAIFWSITILSITYFIVFFVAILALGGSSTTTLVLYQQQGLIIGAEQLLGILGPLMIIAMLFGAAATLNATIYSSSRVALALARDNNLPKRFLKIHPRTRTPWIAIWGSGSIIIFMAVFLPFDDVIASADVLFLLLFIFVNYSAIVLRRRYGDDAFPYKTPLFPLLPILGLISKFILALFLFQFSWRSWVVAILWIICGIIFNAALKRYHSIIDS